MAAMQKVNVRQRVGGGVSHTDTWRKNIVAQAEGVSKCKQGGEDGLARFSNRKEANMVGAN